MFVFVKKCFGMDNQTIKICKKKDLIYDEKKHIDAIKAFHAKKLSYEDMQKICNE